MELYHKTLIPASTHSTALALHLQPISPKEQHDKPKQLLLATSSTLQLYRYEPAQSPRHKYEIRHFHTEEIFSSICAVDSLAYEDESMRKDLVLLTLSNGKYVLLEWMAQKSQFSVNDQALIFGENEQASKVDHGLSKPIPGQYMAVNNESKLIAIASLHGDCKLYSWKLGLTGFRLQTLHCFKRPPIERLSVYMQLEPAYGVPQLFYSLRAEMSEDHDSRVKKVYKIRRPQAQFQEEGIPVDDPTVNLLIPRTHENSFFLVGERQIHFINKGKLVPMKIPQPKPLLAVTWWRRQSSKREQYFILNELGGVIAVTFDQSSPTNPCTLHYVENVAPALVVTPLDRNLFFFLTTSKEYLLVEPIGKYKCEERLEKTRSSSKLKEEKDREEQMKSQSHEFQVVGVMQGGRMIRDMKICNVQKSMNNQILLTGSRPDGKSGFLSVIRYGLKLKSLLSVNCTNPLGIWAIKRHISDKHHTYIVLTYQQRRTITYLYDSHKLTQVSQLKLAQGEITIHVTRFGDNSLAQVAPFRILYNREGVSRDLTIKGRAMKATSVAEGRQLLVLLVGGFLEYYEVTGNELKKIKDMQFHEAEAIHVEFSPPELIDHKPYSRFFASAHTNYHIRIYSISNKTLEVVNSHNFKVNIESLVFLPSGDNMCLHVGAQSGKHFRWEMSSKNAENVDEIVDEVIGERNIKFFKINVMGKPALLRTAPEPQLTYQWQGQTQSCAMPMPSVDICTEIQLQGIKGTVMITYFESYLRLIEAHGFDSLLYINHKDLEMAGKSLLLLEDRVGVLTESRAPVEEKNIWKSKFLFLNPMKDFEPQNSINFETNEKVFSSTTLTNKEGKNIVCFGCSIGHSNFANPANRFPSIKIYSYENAEGKTQVSHLFNFSVDSPPTAMNSYFNKLLVGVGHKLMLYDIFKQKLVERATSDKLSSPILSIHVEGQKIFLTQVSQSFTLMKIDHKTKFFELIGQDSLERFTTCACLIDGEAGLMAGGDKFGNFFVSKLTEKIKSDFEDIKDTTMTESTMPNFMESLVSYNMGQLPTGIQNGCVDVKKPDRIFYTTIDGRVGMLYPLEGDQEEQLNLLRALEHEMGKSTFCGASNHRFYRDFFNPSKGIVDGDFCQLFLKLSEGEKAKRSAGVGKDQKEIVAVLLQMQSKFS